TSSLRSALDRRREIQQRGRAEIAGVRGTAGNCVRKKQPVRSTVNEAAAERLPVVDGGEISVSVDGKHSCASQVVVRLGTDTEDNKGGDRLLCSCHRGKLHNDAIVIVAKETDRVCNLLSRRRDDR